MADDAREIELKFWLPDNRGPEALAWLAGGRPQLAKHLASTYFDTSDGKLRANGFSLRIREEDGARQQTVKSRAPGGELERGEWTMAAAGERPDVAAARQTPAGECLGPRSRLIPQFTVTVDRQVVEIADAKNMVEAALDAGVVQAGGRRAAVNELELELKSGSPKALFALATKLSDAFPAVLSVIAKADRGYALVGDGTLSDRHFEKPKLEPHMSAGDGFQVMARAALEQALWNAEVMREAPSPEAVHQTRVGLRRLRATLKTFKPVVADSRASDVRAALRAISMDIDPARNLDVFIAGARRRLPQAQTAEDAALRKAHTAAYEQARQAGTNPAGRRTLLETLAWIETGPWLRKNAKDAKWRDASLEDFAATSLAKGRKRLLGKGDHLGRLEPAERHKVRIEAKGLRYSADVFGQLFDHPKRSRKFLKALEALLEELGDLNDIVTARRLAPGFSYAEEILAHESAREADLLIAAEAAFDNFRAAKPFWVT